MGLQINWPGTYRHAAKQLIHRLQWEQRNGQSAQRFVAHESDNSDRYDEWVDNLQVPFDHLTMLHIFRQ